MIGAAGIFGVLRFFWPPITVVDTGAQMMLTRGRIQYGFTRADEFRGVFMVFGGNRVNAFWNESPFAYVAGLPLADARTIAAKHPDFHLCASPGAALAREGMVNMFLIGADAPMRDRIDRAISDHDERFDRGGLRLCVTVGGRILRRTSHKIAGQEATVTDFNPFTYIAVEELDAQDCQPLLRDGQATAAAEGPDSFRAWSVGGLGGRPEPPM